MDNEDQRQSRLAPSCADEQAASDRPLLQPERFDPSRSQQESWPNTENNSAVQPEDAETRTLEQARNEARTILANDGLATQLRSAGRDALLGMLVETPTEAQIEHGMHALSVIREPLAAIAKEESRVAGLPEDVRIWYRTPTWQASRRWLTEYLKRFPQDTPTLLENAAERLSAAGDEQGAQSVQRHAELLREAMRVGVDAAYLSLIGEDALREDQEEDEEDEVLPIHDALSSLVVEWVRTSDWDSSREFVAEHAGELLSDEAERLLGILQRNQPTATARRAVAVHLQLLHDIRASGIESAYDALLSSNAAVITGHEELDQLLIEATRLTEQGDAPDRLEALYRRMLDIDAQTPILDPSSRAGFWGTRGNLLQELSTRATGDTRSALLYDALGCYAHALEGYRRDVAPLDWAATMNNKGNTLRAIAESLGSEKRIPLLQDALVCYNQALLEYHRDVAPQSWALTLSNKGNILRELADGLSGTERIRALRQALDCFTEALVEYRHEVAPLNWAMTLTNKGNTLQMLAEGLSGEERTQTLEQAVLCYDDALLEFRRERTPMNWAITMNNKGSILGIIAISQAGIARIETLRRAIAYYDDALLERRREVYPLDWAMTLCNKGNTLGNLADSLRGATRRDTWRQAIECYDQALLEYRREVAPFYWATTLNNKGSTLHDLATNLSGVERARALQDAITCHDDALLELRRETVPADWASTLSNKGNALRDLAQDQRGTVRRGTLLKAIECYDQALLEYTREAAPTNWAATLNNKANALGDLAGRVNHLARDETRRQAIICYDDALLEFRREVAPLDWAMILCNKANALQAMANNLNGTVRLDTLRSAVECCDNALLEFSRDVTPFDWAATLNNKGQALQAMEHSLDGDAKVATLARAASAYTNALTIFTPETHPADHRRIARDIARIYLRQSSLAHNADEEKALLADARQIAASAIASAEFLEIQAPSLPFRQQEWAENASIYNLAACIRALQGDLEEAILLIERGRSRWLDEAAGRRSADLAILSDPDRASYLHALQDVQDIEATGRQHRDPLAFVEEARIANAHLRQVVAKLRKEYPSFLPDRQISVALLSSALRPHEALVYIIPEETGTLVMTLTNRGEPHKLWIHHLTAHDVFKMTIYRNTYDERQLGFLPAALGWLGRDPRPLVKALDVLLPQLGDRLMRDIVQQVRAWGCDRAVLIPSAFLSVLPLHAASYFPLANEPDTALNGRRYACDDVLITYAPSGLTYRDVRQAATRQEQSSSEQRIFVAGNPQLTSQGEAWTMKSKRFLRFAEWEAQRVADLARQRTPPLAVDMAINEQVTRERILAGLNVADLAHLALHAAFNFDDPQTSAFFVAHQEKLLLRDLLDARQAQLSQLRLVVLSACQSAMGDFNRQREEAVGLFGALLAGGVCGVIGTLWPVHDRAAAALMEEFAGRYLCDDQSAEAALRAAALAIRDVAASTARDPSPPGGRTRADGSPPGKWQSTLGWWDDDTLSAEVDAEADDVRLLSDDELVEIRRDVQSFRSVSRDHPIHWAAFVFYGASTPLRDINTPTNSGSDL